MLLVRLVVILCFVAASGHHVESWEFSSGVEQSGDASRKEISPNTDWLFAPADKSAKLNPNTRADDVKLQEILDRVGPDMKPASGFRDYDDIPIQITTRAWQLMRQRVRNFSNHKTMAIWPRVEQLLIESKVSDKCLKAARQVADGAAKLEVWANQLLNSWGTFPPSGLFEGTLGDIGSYQSCVNMGENKHIGHAHYCTVAFRPVLPRKQDYDLVINQEPEELLRIFNMTDTFRALISKAQYYHYVYLKVGTCFPIDCSPIDVQKFSHLIVSQWFLLSGPIKCHSKYVDDYRDPISTSTNESLIISTKDLNNGVYIWKPHRTRTQTVALIVIILLTLFVILITIVDFLCNWAPKMFQDFSSNIEYDGISSRNTQCSRSTKKGNDAICFSGRSGVGSIEGNSIPDSNNNAAEICVINKRPMEPLAVIETGTDVEHIQDKSHYGRSGESVANFIRDCSIITNTQEFFAINQDQLKNDIQCIHGLRCLTMSWIIIAHTIQYNDWSAFARIYEVETHLSSLVNQPLFNGSYIVDTFFLISGFLTSYSVFRAKPNGNMRKSSTELDDHLRQNPEKIYFKGVLEQFSSRSYLIGRYLRLTPQILLVSLLFIVLPLLSAVGGPHWYTMTGEYSENCAKNWWVSLLQVQAFYKPGEMCNFVTWWVSVDMLYHLFALGVILIILKFGSKVVVKLCATIAAINVILQANRHYQLSLPPNLFSTIPQTGAMWTDMTLRFFWTPFAHALPFLLGFYVGYYLAIKRAYRSRNHEQNWLTVKRATYGWLLAISSFVLVLYGTYFWITGQAYYSRLVSTSFYLITQAIWSLSLTWVILACEYGYGGFIASLLSCKLFLVLGKASYLVYLSHFLILFTFFGSQNLLVEPTQLMITYMVIGNVALSMMFGSILCIVFEMPWLKMQRRIMRKKY